MRKVLILVLMTLILLPTIGYNSVNADSTFKVSDAIDYVLEGDGFLIVGNSTTLTGEILQNINTKINDGYYVLIYDFSYKSSSIDEDLSDEKVIATAYYSEGDFNARKTLSTNETNYGQIKKDITDFFLEFMNDEDYKPGNSISLSLNSNLVRQFY